ncbi:hypothetical protein ACHAPA_010846 [Fusarium lateritium]
MNNTEFHTSFKTWYMQKDLPDLFSSWNSYKSVQKEERETENLTLAYDLVPEVFDRFWDTGELSFTFDQDNLSIFSKWSDQLFGIRYVSLQVFLPGAYRTDYDLTTETDDLDPPLMNMVIEILGRCSVRDKNKRIHKFDVPQTSTSFSYKYKFVKHQAPKTGYTTKNHMKHVAPIKSNSLTYTLENV